MRLINADALIEQIEKNKCEPCKKRKEDYNGVRCRACQYGDEMDDIEDAPTIEERKKGKWLDDHGNEKKDGYGADCSVCGWWSEYLTDFCGSCGADMRGTT